MNDGLLFPYHDFRRRDEEGDFELHAANFDTDAVVTPSDLDRIRRRLNGAKVKKILLIHGTFAGNDIAGFMRQLARWSPELSSRLSRSGKQWFDQVAGDIGNFTSDFAEQMASAVNPPDGDEIEVVRFNWSGENLHQGRIHGAIELLSFLCGQAWDPGDRVLTLSHSHGGNLMAMVSQLVGCDVQRRKLVFQSLPRFHRDRVGPDLMIDDLASALPKLDAVTLGMPLRYRWNQQVTAKLLHIVSHRPLNEQNPSIATMPKSLDDLKQASGGDYVQHFGVCGTDFWPPVWSWASWAAEKRLHRIFEGKSRRRDVKRRIESGYRVSLDGKTLLTDYQSCADGLEAKLLGHGIYTTTKWMPYHLKQIVHHLYDS